MAVLGRAAVGQVTRTGHLELLARVHLACDNLPALGHLVHADLEDSWLLRFELARVLELVARVDVGLPVDRDPIERLALSAVFSRTLLTHYLDSVHVLLDFMDTVIEMVIAIIENLQHPALVFRPRVIVELSESLEMGAFVSLRCLLFMMLLRKGLRVLLAVVSRFFGLFQGSLNLLTRDNSCGSKK